MVLLLRDESEITVNPLSITNNRDGHQCYHFYVSVLKVTPLVCARIQNYFTLRYPFIVIKRFNITYCFIFHRITVSFIV